MGFSFECDIPGCDFGCMAEKVLKNHKEWHAERDVAKLKKGVKEKVV